jgi:F-type H+-transporting ATPase subunit a
MSTEHHGLNFVSEISSALGLGEFEPNISALLAAGALTALGLIAVAGIMKRDNRLVPERKLSMTSFFDLILEAILKLADSTMGRENRRYLPLVCTLFLFIAISNLLGLVPGFSMPTDNFTVNFGIGLIVFVIYNGVGIHAAGFVNYMKHFCGPALMLAPLLFPIEIFSHCVRPLSLSMRLFGNMTADHAILEAFTDLSRPLLLPIPVVFYLMGTFVSLMQAFIFTVLTMVYIRIAASSAEEHH